MNQNEQRGSGVVGIPAAAVEAAAWEIAEWQAGSPLDYQSHAYAAVAAALPHIEAAIRQHIANEIEADARVTVQPEHPDWCQGYGVGMSAAASIARGLSQETPE